MRVALAVLMFLYWIGDLAATSPYVPKIIDPLSQSWRWKQFPELEGKGVRHVCDGPDRTVWVAFNEGIYRYDGYTWHLFDERHGLDDAPMKQVFVASNGTVYAASDRGVYELQRDRWISRFRAPEGVSFSCYKLTELDEGQMAVAYDRGLLLLSATGPARLLTSEAINKK